MGLNGFTRSITTESGVELEAAYYHIGRIMLAHESQPKRLVFHLNMYASKAAYDANPRKRPLNERSDENAYMVQGEEFDTWFADSVVKQEGKSLVSQAYLYAKDKMNDPNIVDIEDEE